MTTEWKENFILYGKLCDDRTLQNQLNTIRKILQAETAILLVSREDQFFRSMIFVADESPQAGTELQKVLIERCNETTAHRTGRLPPESIRVGDLERVRDIFPQEAVYLCLKQRFGGAANVLASLYHHSQNVALLPTDQLPPSLMVVALNTPQSFLETPEGKASQKALIEAKQELMCMVNASQAVRGHRWNYSARQVDDLLDQCESEWEAQLEQVADATMHAQSNEFERILHFSAGKLLDLATKLTRSSIGQVYLTQPRETVLRVVASREYSCEDLQLPIGESEVDGIVALAYSRVRAVLINDIGKFLERHPRVRYRKPTRAAEVSRAELAIPITQNTAGDEQGVLGVLNVEKSATDIGEYTTRNLDVCQHLVRRFCRWRARIQHTIFARSLAQLTRKIALASDTGSRSPNPGNHESTEEGPVWSSPRGHIHRCGPDWYDDRVPSEFQKAVRPVEEALRSVFQLTRSHMARVFLVTADGSHLVPFCDFPATDKIRRTEPCKPVHYTQTGFEKGPSYLTALDEGGGEICLPVIGLDRHAESITAWVARHGRPCFIGNFGVAGALEGHEGLQSYLRTHQRTRSECCVPLFICGRLVGTLNFQSYYENVYREQRHLIEAMAELISLTFAHERRAVEQEMLENRAVMAYYRHELIHAVRDLQQLQKERILQQQSFQDEEISQLIEQLQTKLTSDKVDFTPREENTKPTHFTALLHQRLNQTLAGRRYQLIAEPGALLENDFVANDVVFPFFFALDEALRNSLEESYLPGESGKSIDVRCLVKCLGGKQYAVIQITNRCTSGESAQYQHQLYRLPYRKTPTDRKHLGTFIAGCVLRAVGGEVSFELNPAEDKIGGYLATAHIDVPLLRRR